jgi:hypothetical protein
MNVLKELGQNLGVTDFLWNVEETSFTISKMEREREGRGIHREREWKGEA